MFGYMTWLNAIVFVMVLAGMTLFYVGAGLAGIPTFSAFIMLVGIFFYTMGVNLIRSE